MRARVKVRSSVTKKELRSEFHPPPPGRLIRAVRSRAGAEQHHRHASVSPCVSPPTSARVRPGLFFEGALRVYSGPAGPQVHTWWISESDFAGEASRRRRSWPAACVLLRRPRTRCATSANCRDCVALRDTMGSLRQPVLSSPSPRPIRLTCAARKFAIAATQAWSLVTFFGTTRKATGTAGMKRGSQQAPHPPTRRPAPLDTGFPPVRESDPHPKAPAKPPYRLIGNPDSRFPACSRGRPP